MKRIAIIGAGPAGSQAAYLLAQQGHQVDVYEEHPVIGKPVQCTGIVTAPFQDIMGTEEQRYVVNKINKIRIFAPNGDSIEFTFKNADWIIDRTGFDQYLAERAQKEGARYHTQHHFLSYRKDGNGLRLSIKDEKSKKLIEKESDILIGADGPMSNVAKASGLYGDRKFFFGAQPVMQMENTNVIEVYPARTGFCWVTPITPYTVKAGIAAEQKANQQLQAFMIQRFGADHKSKLIEMEGGLVPVFNPRQKVQNGNVYLVGDASTSAKATTAGGIIQALIGAKALATSISEKKNYQSLWNNQLGREMHLSLVMRRMLNKFKDKDYNTIVSYLKKPRTKGILETYSRDYPSRFVLKLMMSEPRLLTYAKYLV